MAFPTVGSLYYGGKINGSGPVVWTQPGGPGTPVSPLLPTLYPQEFQGYPQAPFAFEGLLVLGCGHWINCVEVFEVYHAATKKQAAVCCCPACGYVALVVEPYSEWENNYFQIYPLGLGEKSYTDPSVNPNLP